MRPENYHPDILKLEIKEIDTPFTNEKHISVVGSTNKFFIVPTDMVVARYLEHDLWKGCPPLVNFDMLKCIEEIEEEGKYPYNSTVGELFCKKYGLEKYIEHSFLSAVVYYTQCYKGCVRDEEKAKLFDETMRKDGYIPATKEILEQAFINKTKYIVPINGTKKPRKLIKHEGNLIWMATNATRRGYAAQSGQYIKPYTTKEKV